MCVCLTVVIKKNVIKLKSWGYLINALFRGLAGGKKRINAAFEDDGVSEFHMSHPSVGNDSLE